MLAIAAVAKPVFSAKWDGARARIENLYGTALPLGRDLLLTADHVVANVLDAAPEFAVGWGAPEDSHEPGGPVPFSRASVAARWPEVDLAALRLPAPLENLPAWDMGIHAIFTPVASIGFPFGYDVTDKTVTPRGFSGNIVCSHNYPRFSGNPSVYELSFATPRGLSGGPLLLGARICGAIVGNHQTKMLVFSDEERVEESGAVTRVERYEVMNLGIAITARSILDLRLPDKVRLFDFVRAAGTEIVNVD